jgi:hypothetical protein
MEVGPNDDALNSDAGCGMLIARLFPVSQEISNTLIIMAKNSEKRIVLVFCIMIIPINVLSNYKHWITLENPQNIGNVPITIQHR